MSRRARVLLVGVRWGPYVPLGALFIARHIASQCDLHVVFGSPTDSQIADADLVGLSSSSFGIEVAIEIAARCRALGVRTILGGIHGTFAPEDMLARGFDYVVRGEGEAAIEQLLAGDAQHCCRTGPRGPILAPVHAATSLDRGYDGRFLREGFWGTGYERDGTRHELGPLVTSRGCPHRCIFCTVPGSHPGLRLQSLTSVEEQIRAVKASGYSGVRIYDSIFGQNPAHGAAVASILHRHGLAWIAETTVGAASDEDLLRHYRECGCIKLEFGLETASPDLLRTLRKPFSLGVATRVLQMVQRHGIQVETYIIVGAPGQTDADVARLVKWFDEVMPENLSVSLLSAYPGTELYRRAKEGYGEILERMPLESVIFDTAGNGQRYVWVAPGTTLEDNVRRAEEIYGHWTARGGSNPWVSDRIALGARDPGRATNGDTL